MRFSLKTSDEAQRILLEMKDITNITPNILSRYAISLSLAQPEPVSKFNYNTRGLEFNRHILTGKYDVVFKALISHKLQKELTDEEYYPDYIKAHLERGIRLLHAEYKYAGNVENFLVNLSNYKFGGNM
ncbi:DNA sulfur modification protein DndE [Anaerovirgula multivorans]|uniref:DNA sulfur modification protein DndE n=1 Tax=Anaerovirgula multivorans TaxID=312168 RepID=A0A239CL35_9FIRM|nr:DNA sulfur modification protein DndE [Anaerovirgula multivorans]SNS20428.1 DNA sulfur modification protein DndE [Anaerovirgula multivorans]